MNDSDVEEVLIAQLAASRAMTRDEVLVELQQTGGVIDSLEGIELVIEAERTFGVKISDRELSSGICRSIPTLAALVRSKLASTAGPQGGQNNGRSNRDRHRAH